MNGRRARRAADTAFALFFFAKVHWVFRVRGQRATASRTSTAMRSAPAPQEQLDALGIDPWQVGRAVWRAKRYFPLKSTCLHTAFVTRDVLARRGAPSVLRVGARQGSEFTHAWVEVGNFVLDDQRIAHTFVPFEPAGRPATQEQSL